MKKNTMTKRNFFLFSINYIIGFGFIATIGKIINLNAIGLLAFMITSFLALAVALVFSRGTSEYPNSIGGSYYYAKKSGGKHNGFIQGWIQYMQGPILSATAPLFLSTIFKEIDPSRDVLYDSLSVSIFIIITIIVTFGYKISFKFIAIAAILKWIIIVMSVIAVIYLVSLNNHFSTNWLGSPKLNLLVFMNAVLQFMYAYGGIEGISSLAGEVETNKFRKLLLKTFFVIFTFYFLFYLIFMGINLSEINSNNVKLFQKIFTVTMGSFGAIVYTIGIINNKISSRASSAITVSRSIVALSKDDYFPKIISKKNKKGEYAIAIYLNSSVSILMMLIFVTLPHLISIGNAFNLILDIGLFLFFAQYIGTFISIIILSKKQKIKKIPIWELAIYIATVLIMIFVVIIVLFPPLTNQPWKIKNTIQIISLVTFIAIGYGLWGVNYLFNNRLKQ